VAKRSVKKARHGRPAAPDAPAAERAENRRGRPFWLGVLVTAALLIPLGVAGVLIASSGDEPEPSAQASTEAEIESEAEAFRRQTQVRDKEQVKELTDRMRETTGELAPTLDGLAKTLPPGEEGFGPPAQASAVQEWRRAVRAADEYFAESVSGETGTNVARGGFAAALDALTESTETYRLALDQPPAARRKLFERARAQRDLAVRSWSVAATQLDAINIATGYGHQHVYLGGAEASGGFGADPVPEGTGAEDAGHEDE
jgi:hypothetical protein